MTEVYEYTSPQEMRQNFAQIYHKEVKPMMEEFEKIRVEECKTLEKCRWVSCLIGLGVIVLFLQAHSIFFTVDAVSGPKSELIALLCHGVLVISVFVVAIYKVISIIKSYIFAGLMKQSCMPKLMKAFGNLEHRIGERVIPDTALKNSKLFKNIESRYPEDDSFVGTYKGVSFKISEIAIENFKGTLIDFQANKTIKNTTIIQPRYVQKRRSSILASLMFSLLFLSFSLGFSVLFFGGIHFIFVIFGLGPLFTEFFTFLKKSIEIEVVNQIKLEDAEFEKYYVVSSSDEVEGRYLITTAFIQRFKDMKKAFGVTDISCSFYDNNLMFAIPSNKNLFEIGKLSKPLTNAKYIEQFYNQMIAILQIIEQFKLDEKTGL